MPIRPVEIIQSQSATQYKHVESQRAVHEQVQNSNNFQNVLQEKKRKTEESAKSDNIEYRFDASKKGNSEYYNSSGNGKKKNKDNKDDKDEGNKPPSSGGIDILI